MKQMNKSSRYLIALAITIILIPALLFAYGPITHVGAAEDILEKAKRGELPPDIASAILQNPDYFKAGSIAPDLFYANLKSEFTNKMHDTNTREFYITLYNEATTPEEKAFAYGAILHYAGDTIGHDYVNIEAGGPYKKNIATKTLHLLIESVINHYILTKHKWNDTSLDLDYWAAIDIAIPTEFFKKVYEEIYGINASPDMFDFENTEFLNEIRLLIEKEILDEAEIMALMEAYGLTLDGWEEAYNESINKALEYMVDPNAIKNVSLEDNSTIDSEDMPRPECGDSDGISGSNNSGSCSGDGGANSSSSPGGGHPDDTVSYSDGNVLSAGISASDYTRVGLKKGQKGRLVFRKLKEIYEEYRNLPADTPLEIRQQKFNALFDYYTSNIKNWQERRELGIYNLSLAKDTVNPADVVILKRGFFKNTGNLIEKYNEPVLVRSTKFSPQIVEDRPVLVIPSGGLYGMENSSFFKASLDEYVKQGGTLVVFAQQHGYEFSVLPVPQEEDSTYRYVSGYGWNEDQSCFTNAVYVDMWHQMLAGQGRSTPTLSVDGYFTDYPSNATVLLRRTKNGQPAMIMYEYGQGRVIATSMYSDWAYGSSQASSEEIALVRDMIAWAKAPAQLSEVKRGEAVTVTLSMVNLSNTDAASVRILIYDPNRSTLLLEQTMGLSVPAGQSASTSVSYQTSSSSPLGIYHVDYELLDSNGNVIQPQAETDSGRFAVVSPPADTYEERDFYFSIQSDSEKYAYGSTAIFTVTTWNNTDEDKELTFKYDLVHISAKWEEQWGLTHDFVAIANTATSFNIVVEGIDHEGWLRGRFYDSTGNVLPGYPHKGVWVFRPAVGVAVQADRDVYGPGDTVNLNVNMQNMTSASYPATLKVDVLNPVNAGVYSVEAEVNLDVGATLSQNFSFDMPSDATRGYYTVTAEVFGTQGNKIGGDSGTFELPLSLISITPDLSSPLAEGANNVPFVLKNIGKVDVSSGVFDFNIKDPDGDLLHSDSQTFALAVGEEEVIYVPMAITLKFGDYVLEYTMSDETRIRKASILIPNSPNIDTLFDKPAYKVRGTANLTLDIASDNFILNDAALTLSIPDADYVNSQIITLLPDSPISLNYDIQLPETLLAGQHDVNITLTLPSGSSMTKNIKLAMLASSLKIGYSGPESVTAGDTINLTVENTGGVDTSYTTEELYIIDEKGVVIYNGSAAGNVLAGEKKTLADIQIPAQTAEGTAFLIIRTRDIKANRLYSILRRLDVEGLAATLDARTDQDVYLNTEEVTATATLINDDYEITNGSLDIIVNKYETEAAQDKFVHFIPDKWAKLISPFGIAVGPYGDVYTMAYGKVMQMDADGNVIGKWGSYSTYDNGNIGTGPDGSVYLTDCKNNMVKKYDKDGNFIKQWGGYGSGNGQFNRPKGVAVDRDGYVYIADTRNNRVQKFDREGNFISKFGSYGSGDGKFSWPHDIAINQEDGSIYVADTKNNRVQKFNKNFEFVLKWGSNSPYGIGVDFSGNVYVAEVLNHRVQIYNSEGGYISTINDASEGGVGFWYPYDVAVDSDGSVYITLWRYEGSVLKYDSEGKYVYHVGGSGQQEGRFYHPYDLTVDSDGYIYVADKDNARIQKFDTGGNFVRSWKYPNDWGQPEGITVDEDGFVYVIAYRSGEVRKFDGEGNLLLTWGDWGYDDGQFSKPSGIVAGPDGSIYVSDRSRADVQKFSSDGEFLIKWGGYGTGDDQFRYPYDIAVDSEGMVYVADANDDSVKIFDSNGTFIKKLETHYDMENDYYYDLNNPEALAVDKDGFIYVAGNSEYRIQKIDKAGDIVGQWFHWDEGYDALNEPLGMAAGPDGTIYIADTYNHRLLKMERSGGKGISGILFEATIPINQAPNTSIDYATQVGILNATGKLYLHAELKNELGQTIAEDSYPFYIIEGDTVLLFNTDKKIYRPGETVSITGEVRNLASIVAEGLTLNLEQGSDALYTSTFDVPAGGSHPFTFTTPASDEGTYMLKGTVVQNGSTLVEILDQYEVANPVVVATVTTPDVAGNEPFDVTVELKNDGKVDASVTLQSSIDNVVHDIEIPAGETRAIQYSGQITGSTTYTFTFTGDLEQTITKAVDYGLGASITVSPDVVYPEGRVEIPVTLQNTGMLDEALNVAYILEPGGITESKAYYIPAGTSVSDTLYYDLPEGEYTVSAVSQLPDASAQASFSVKKENNVLMTMTVGSQTGELIPVGVDLTNLGYNTIDGSLRYALSGAEGEVWSGEQEVTGLLSGEARAMSFDINPSALAPGDYTLSVILIDNSGQTIAASSAPLTVLGPVFEMTQLPSYQTFQPGHVAEMTFKVKNIGNVEGAVELALSAYDLIDTNQREWLGPNEERSFTFGFMLPDDLEEKDYFADYKLSDEGGALITSGQVKYHLAGISITVDASLDKQYYLEGETAHLTLNVQSQSTATLPLFARVNYAGYEAEQIFTLDGNLTLAFDVPLTEITGEKLFYGIYYESGRSIHLNSLYIHEAGDELTIITDKQVYDPGETVALTITSEQYSGTLTVSSLDYSATMPLSGSVSDSFTLPGEMTAGTYTIRATLTTDSGETFTEAYPFDVAGMQVKVLECVNDKGKYALSDTITTSYTISSNTEIPATLKTWIVDPEGRYTPAGEEAITLTSDENLLFTGQTALETEIAGIHRLVYGIYRGDLLLVSGSESFDVGDAVLLGLSTDKTDYPTNSEPVIVTASMFGTAGANLELLIDDVPVQSQQVTLDGFVNMDIDLGTVEPGVHTLKGILTAGGLKSTKGTGFVYGSTLPDLTVRGSYAAEVSKENTMELSFTVTNSGKTPAAQTALTLYSGDEPIETIAVSVLQPEESAEHTVNLDVLGKAGEYEITAVADDDDSVVEFNEKNNSMSLTVNVPELTLFSSTGMPEYRIREDADIIADVTNLSVEAINGYRLRTVVTSPLGTVAFEEVADMPELTAETLTTVTTVWNIPDSAEEGMHEIQQQVLNADDEAVAASSVSVEVLASDFILSIEPVSFDLRQGEDAVVSGSIEPLGIFDSEVSLLVEGLPEGASHVLNPCTVAVPGEFTLKVLTNQETVAGAYQIKITAEGDDIIHEAVFDISISAFELKAETDTADIEQLESASFALDVNSLNGYEGDVTLDISGVPHGVMASFGNTDVIVPDSVTLSVLTSKYATPGEYVLTVSASDELVTHSQELTLKVLANPAIAKGIIVTQGPGPKNEAWVRALGTDLSPVMEIIAFDTKYGAYAASADIDGDGYDEIIAAQGPDPKNKAVLRAIGRDGTLMAEYQTFDANYGLTVSSGDLDGDWTDELVVGMGPDPKNPTLLKVLKYSDGSFNELTSVEAYENLKYGVNTAVGDIDGDNMPEIVTVPGPDPKNLAMVKVWEYDGQNLTEVGQFLAFDTRYGATVATGDTDGDGVSEIIVGTGPDPKSLAVVRIFEANGEFVGEYWPYGEDYGYGVNVAAVDLNSDGIDELITGLGPGPQNKPWLKVLAMDGSELASYLAYPENTKYGVRVCPARPGVVAGD